MDFSESQKRDLISCAHEAIRARLEHRKPLCTAKESKEFMTKSAAFVTIHEGGRLRGCIGSITPSRPLLEMVMEMAVESAVSDPRFAPLTAEELDVIDLEISVLSPFERISDPEQVIPGTHGVYIRRGSKAGLLLPQVATEQNWDRTTLLTHLCYKAGLLGDAWKSPDSDLFIFTAVIVRETELT